VEVTLSTYLIAIFGIIITVVLFIAQLIAVIRPKTAWTIENIYGGRPDSTDPKAYFAFNQGLAIADVFFWLPVQLVGCVGMLLGQKWGFLLALVGSVPFWYTAILIFIWDRDLQSRENTVKYWMIWGIFPVFGIIEGVYCVLRLLR
jgi:hypothetical protein